MSTLRAATPDDVTALAALIERSGRELRDGYTEAQAAALTVHVFGVDSQLVTDGTYFVIEDGGVLIACGGWSRRRTLFGGDQAKAGPDPLLDPLREPARIRAFFVDPTQARRGLGRRLLAACEDAARAHGFAVLELVSTAPGEPLYRAGGFEVVERFVLRLPGRVEAPVARMRKPLA
ncbi:GNAT family N-acetyltransferase [Rubrivirga sp. IMCC43871]|uniref:GNAT family N-acetyltransferase n=1 Tax=Rubrivirga sp. IMCC43871 TaxID=3391575 RepID=UPI00398FE671